MPALPPRFLWTAVWLALLTTAACTPADDAEPFVGEHPLAQLDTAAVPPALGPANPANPSQGQTLYVPIYSHIYFKTQGRTIDLAATVSIRNTDRTQGLVLSTLDYIDNNGALVRRYLAQPRRLEPLASTSVLIEESDAAGGLGANFLVEWSAAEPISPPVVESIMISTRSSLGISFTSPARVLTER